jgi:hypothetical protein
MTHPTEWLPEAKDTSSPVFLKRYGNDDLIEGCLSVECVFIDACAKGAQPRS